MVPSANSVMWNVSWPLAELIAGAPVQGFVSGWTEVLFLVTVVSLMTGGPAADAVLATASVASVTPTSTTRRIRPLKRNLILPPSPPGEFWPRKTGLPPHSLALFRRQA